MTDQPLNATTGRTALASLPLAELHLHLEGSIAPSTVADLAERHGVQVSRQEVIERYSYSDFAGFIEAFKWVTSFLRKPRDYALVTERLAEELLRQSVVYAEVTISAGVMLLRQQAIAPNFAAIVEAAAPFERRGLKFNWIFDTVRQFGPDPAMMVARAAAELRTQGVVAFGIGGDELSRPAVEFRPAFDFAHDSGLHTVAHAGEIGGPDSIREALIHFHAERIGHGIAAVHDAALCEELASSRIPLEICPTSNIKTGALAEQIDNRNASLRDHPVQALHERGVRVTISTDDPGMFDTTLRKEYAHAGELGLSPSDLIVIAENSYRAAFLPEPEKERRLRIFRERARTQGLL